MDTGSREENASDRDLELPVLFQPKPVRLQETSTYQALFDSGGD
jgi:hypothetical protein